MISLSFWLSWTVLRRIKDVEDIVEKPGNESQTDKIIVWKLYTKCYTLKV